MAWIVTSSSTVCGKTTGGTLTEQDLAGCNIAALVAGGHLVEKPADKPAKASKTPAVDVDVDPADD